MLPASNETYQPIETRQVGDPFRLSHRRKSCCQPAKIVLRLRAHWERSVDDVEIEHSRIERQLKRANPSTPVVASLFCRVVSTLSQTRSHSLLDGSGVRERMKVTILGIKGLPSITQRARTFSRDASHALA
jgi:hypothetical protein